MEKINLSSKPSGDSAIDSIKTFPSIILRTQKQIRACVYAGSALIVVFLTEGGILFFLSVKYETLPFLFLLTLLGLIGSVAIIAWSHQARRVINELLFLAEARGKQERSTLAHDIRNILAIIQADVEIALMGETSGEELRKTLKQIMTETDEINSKLNEV